MTIDAASAHGGRYPRWARGIFIANLVAQAVIVVTGATVRLTGSGLGCPTWPECTEGSYVPTSRQEEAWHKYVEFGNRTLTFALGALAIAAIVAGILVWLRRRRAGLPGRTAVLLLAAIPLVGTAVQAVLGGITVLTGLHPLIVGAHFLVSMAIIAGCVALVVRSGDGSDAKPHLLVRREIRWLAWLLVLVSAVVVVLGVVVTGSGPHSGDADVEARFSFDPRTVAWLHADVVLLFLGLAVGLLIALKATDGPARAVRRTLLLLAVALVQGAVGYTQYFSGLPVVLVAIHVAGACAVWIAVLFIPPALRTR